MHVACTHATALPTSPAAFRRIEAIRRNGMYHVPHASREAGVTTASPALHRVAPVPKREPLHTPPAASDRLRDGLIRRHSSYPRAPSWDWRCRVRPAFALVAINVAASDARDVRARQQPAASSGSHDARSWDWRCPRASVCAGRVASRYRTREMSMRGSNRISGFHACLALPVSSQSIATKSTLLNKARASP